MRPICPQEVLNRVFFRRVDFTEWVVDELILPIIRSLFPEDSNVLTVD